MSKTENQKPFLGYIILMRSEAYKYLFLLIDRGNGDEGIIHDVYTLDAALQESRRFEAEGYYVAYDPSIVKETIPSETIPDHIVKKAVDRARDQMREAAIEAGFLPEVADEWGDRIAEIKAQSFGSPLITMDPKGRA